MEKTNLSHVGMKSVMFCKNNIHALFCMGLSFDIFFVALFSHPLPSLVTCLLLLTPLFVRTDLKSKLPMSSNYSVHCSMMASARFFSAIRFWSRMSLLSSRTCAPLLLHYKPKIIPWLRWRCWWRCCFWGCWWQGREVWVTRCGWNWPQWSPTHISTVPFNYQQDKEDGKVEKEKEWATTWW